jgi:AraC-like DNA-binding protein
MIKKPYSTHVLVTIAQIKQHIDNNPFQCKKAGDLLDRLTNVKRSTLEKAFKDIYCVGIKEYQVRMRMEASKAMLENGMSKKEVACKCCYKSPSAFSAAFKKEFKMTPTEWQSTLRLNENEYVPNFYSNGINFDNNGTKNYSSGM